MLFFFFGVFVGFVGFFFFFGGGAASVKVRCFCAAGEWRRRGHLSSQGSPLLQRMDSFISFCKALLLQEGKTFLSSLLGGAFVLLVSLSTW